MLSLNRRKKVITIIIADKNSIYSDLLYNILMSEIKKYKKNKFRIIIMGNTSLLTSYKKKQIHLAFIDLNFVLEESLLVEKFKIFNKNTMLVLLISDENGKHLKKGIGMLEQPPYFHFNEHLLKSNYSSTITTLICRDLLSKTLENNKTNETTFF